MGDTIRQRVIDGWRKRHLSARKKQARWFNPLRRRDIWRFGSNALLLLDIWWQLFRYGALRRGNVVWRNVCV
jgi:hypothetical protein